MDAITRSSVKSINQGAQALVERIMEENPSIFAMPTDDLEIVKVPYDALDVYLSACEHLDDSINSNEIGDAILAFDLLTEFLKFAANPVDCGAEISTENIKLVRGLHFNLGSTILVCPLYDGNHRGIQEIENVIAQATS